jgi:hypothetical protein
MCVFSLNMRMQCDGTYIFGMYHAQHAYAVQVVVHFSWMSVVAPTVTPQSYPMFLVCLFVFGCIHPSIHPSISRPLLTRCCLCACVVAQIGMIFVHHRNPRKEHHIHTTNDTATHTHIHTHTPHTTHHTHTKHTHTHEAHTDR